METYRLVPHPLTPPGRVTAVEVEVIVAPGDDMLMTFRVDGAEHLLVPQHASPGRRDGLWQSTCFELFLKPVGGDAYFEFNFSPSTEWAAYRFDGHREGRENLERPVDPHIDRLGDGEEVIEVDFDLSGLPNVPMRMGLSAVLEERDGTKSYWALAHPPGDADFHHAACFAAELPPARPA